MTLKGEVWVLGGNACKHLKVVCDGNCSWQASLSAAVSTPFSLLWEELTLNLILIKFQFRKCSTPILIPNISTLKKVSDELFPYNVKTSKLKYQHIWKWRKLNKVNDINQPTHQSNRALKGTFLRSNSQNGKTSFFFFGIFGSNKISGPPLPPLTPRVKKWAHLILQTSLIEN